jgi:hypothetical protein
MQINLEKLVSLLLICVTFFFILACLDYLLMSSYNFWQNTNKIYEYWLILWCIVLVFSFGLSFLSYLFTLPLKSAAAVFLTPILLFTAGLLDLFYALLCYLQGQNYGFWGWSFGYKLFVENNILPAWDWPEQIIFDLFFFTLLTLTWYWALKK